MKKTLSNLDRGIVKQIAVNIAMIGGIILALAIIAHFVMQLSTRHRARSIVPNFTGITITQAKSIAQEVGVEIHINDSLYVPIYEGGTVLDQLPQGGVEVKPGRTIYVTINSFSQKEVQIPYVAERSLRQAKNMLEIAGLEIEEIVYEPDIATNYVLRASWNGKEITKDSRINAKMGSGITLTVGVESEAQQIIMPTIIGLSLKEAKSSIWGAGLNVGRVTYDENVELGDLAKYIVYRQSLVNEQYTTLGAKVDIGLTMDEKRVTKAVKESEELAKQIIKERAIQDSINRVSELNSLENTEPLEESLEDYESSDSDNNDDFF